MRDKVDSFNFRMCVSILSILLSMVDNFYFQDVREHIDDVRDRENEIGGVQAFFTPQNYNQPIL